MAKIDFDKKFSGLSPGDMKALQDALRQDLDLAEKKKQVAAAKKAKEPDINKKGQPQAGILNSKEKNIMAKAKIEAPPQPQNVKYEAVKGLAGDKDIDDFLNSAEFREKEKKGGESAKEALAEWLSQKRMGKGYAVGEIDKARAATGEDRRKAYEKWDWYRAEEILDKFGDAYVDENFGQRPDKKAPEAPTAEPSKETKDLDEKEKVITGKMEEGLAEMKEKTKSPEEFLKEAREKYVKALLDKEKADKAEGKLKGVRGWLSRHFGKKEADPDKDSKEYWKNTVDKGAGDKASAVVEKNAATVEFERAQQELKDALKNYREEKIALQEQVLRGQGLSQDKIDKYLQRYAQELLTETTVKEAAEIYDLKKGELARGASADKSTWEWTKNSFLNVSQAYRKWPTKYKILASVGLLGGAMAAGSLGGASALAIGGCVVTGRGLQRILGGMSATVGTEALMKRSQEKKYERRLTKEMSANFVEALQKKGDALDNRMLEILGRKNFDEKKRWGLSLALGGLIGSGAAGQAYRYAGHYAGIGGRYLFGLIPPGVKAAVAEHIDKIWQPQDYAAQYEQWKGQIGEHAGRLKDEATPYYESAKDYADKVWAPWREKVYSALGIGQSGTGVFEVPDNYGAGAQSSLGGSDLGGGALSGEPYPGHADYYHVPEDYPGKADYYNASGGAKASVAGLSGEMSPGGTTVPEGAPYYETGMSGAGRPSGVPDAPGGERIPADIDKATYVGGIVPDIYDRPRGAGPAWVDDPENQKISGAPSSQSSIDGRVAGAFGPQAEQLPADNNIAGAFGPQAEQLPANNNVAGAFGPTGEQLPADNKIAGALGPQAEQATIDNKAAGAFGPQPEQLPADNKIAAAFGPQAESLSGAEIAKRGDSVWKMLDRQLQTRYGETFTGLDAAERTYLIDALKDKVAENPGKFGLDNIDKVQLGKNYDLGSLFADEDVVQKQFGAAGALKEAAAKNILQNNKVLEDWVNSHKGQALTSEKVEEILRGGEGVNLSEAVADNSSGSKVFETTSGPGDVSSGAEGGETEGLTELVPTDESGQPLSGTADGQTVDTAPGKPNALPENPPQDVSGRIEEMFTANETANRDALGFRNAAEYKAVRDIKVGKLLEQVPANKDEAWAIYRQEAPGRSIDLPSYGAIGPTPAKFGRLIELSKFIDSFKPGAGAKEMTVSQFLKMTGPEQLVGH